MRRLNRFRRAGRINIYENRVVEIFSALDTFPDEKKEELAIALKAYWQRNNKWKKKQYSPKQLTKVHRIKEVLGEK